MKFEQYKFKFYLNANHSILINRHMGAAHPHTWEISITANKSNNNFVRFGDVETSIDSIFSKYQDKLLNEIEPFNTINPTLENICEVFMKKVRAVLGKMGWRLKIIEVSETPSRSFVINLSNEDIVPLDNYGISKMDKKERERLISKIIDEVKHEPPIKKVTEKNRENKRQNAK